MPRNKKIVVYLVNHDHPSTRYETKVRGCRALLELHDSFLMCAKHGGYHGAKIDVSKSCNTDASSMSRLKNDLSGSSRL